MVDLNGNIAQQELEKERHILKQIIDLNPYGIQIFNNKGYIETTNKAVIKLFGSGPPEGYNVYDDPNHQRTDDIKNFDKALSGEIVYMPENWYNRHDVDPNAPDKPTCNNITGFPVFDSKGEVEKIVFMFEDITEKKIAQQELEKERNFLKSIIELNPYPIAIKDKDGFHLGENQAFRDYWRSVPQKDYSVLKDPSFPPGVIDLMQKASQGRIVNLPEFWFNPQEASKSVTPVGDYPTSNKCSKTVIFPTFREEGVIDNLIFITEDVTERRLAEMKLEELKNELEIRVKERTFNLESSEKKFKKAYQRANCYKGLFTHDISNIFQIVSNSLELCQMALDKDLDKTELKEMYETMENQINRGMKMVFNIKNLSEIEDTEMPIEEKSVTPYLDNAISFVKENFQNREIEIDIKVSGEDPNVLANDLLLDVFENILINAVRYNDNPKAEIKIIISEAAENDNSYVKFTFIDNGIGIEDSRKQEIFIKKYKNIRERKGMGLGLSLVSEILDLYEGKIWVEDRIKGDHTKGSEFIFLIPKATV